MLITPKPKTIFTLYFVPTQCSIFASWMVPKFFKNILWHVRIWLQLYFEPMDKFGWINDLTPIIYKLLLTMWWTPAKMKLKQILAPPPYLMVWFYLSVWLGYTKTAWRGDAMPGLQVGSLVHSLTINLIQDVTPGRGSLFMPGQPHINIIVYNDASLRLYWASICMTQCLLSAWLQTLISLKLNINSM